MLSIDGKVLESLHIITSAKFNADKRFVANNKGFLFFICHTLNALFLISEIYIGSYWQK